MSGRKCTGILSFLVKKAAKRANTESVSSLAVLMEAWSLVILKDHAATEYDRRSAVRSLG